jgi:hypothetical protein
MLQRTVMAVLVSVNNQQHNYDNIKSCYVKAKRNVINTKNNKKLLCNLRA